MKTLRGIVLNSRMFGFCIHIEEDKTIRDLAKELQARNYPHRPSRGCIFYLAKKDGRWLRSSDPEARVLRPVITERGQIPASMKKHFGDSNVLDPDSLVSDYNFPDKDNVRSDEYHVLLDRPVSSFDYCNTSFRDSSSATKSVAWGVFASQEVGFLGFLQKEGSTPGEEGSVALDLADRCCGSLDRLVNKILRRNEATNALVCVTLKPEKTNPRTASKSTNTNDKDLQSSSLTRILTVLTAPLRKTNSAGSTNNMFQESSSSSIAAAGPNSPTSASSSEEIAIPDDSDSTTDDCELFYVKYVRVGNVRLRINCNGFFVNLSHFDLDLPPYVCQSKLCTTKKLLQKFESHLKWYITKESASSGLSQFKNKLLKWTPSSSSTDSKKDKSKKQEEDTAAANAQVLFGPHSGTPT